MAKPGKNTVSGFFKKFTHKECKYRVYVVVHKTFGAYLNSLGFDVYNNGTSMPKTHSAAAKKSIQTSLEQSIFYIQIPAFDEEKAAANIDDSLQSVRALGLLVPHQYSFVWEQRMYVIRARAKAGDFFKRETLPLHRDTVAPSQKRAAKRAIGTYSKKVLSTFTGTSTSRVISSLSTSALAHSSLNIENQLISLWSAIEVLLSEPPQGKARIVHYIELLGSGLID